MKRSLWAEAANYETDTCNILVSKANEKCAYEKFYGEMPRYAKYLRPFGSIGYAKFGDSKIVSKLKNKGVECIMIGYAKDNASGTYRLLNTKTNSVFKSRNVQWTGRLYKDK